jgi:cytochrome c oxidase assembly protein subunit 11
MVSESLSASVKSARNLKTLTKLAVFSLAMFGFGYVMVPFYPVVCAQLGINVTGKDETNGQRVANTQVDYGRLVSVEFDTNVHGMPWQFKPITGHLSVHPGELSHAVFEVVNTRDVPVTGQAIPSYGPVLAGEYFHKLECFCFSKQTLGPGERKEMPVVFVIDPALPRDISTITLSYTFFEVEGNGQQSPPSVGRNG